MRLVGAVTGLFCLAGCEGAPADSRVVRVDSAGVTIVQSHAPRWDEGSGWSVDLAAVIDLSSSGTGPSHEFYRVGDATVLSDGRIVVLDGGSQEVRFFSPDGAFMSSMGREGEGPGEFEALTSVAQFAGDSVLVFDFWLGRVTILDWSGSMARVQTLSREQQVQKLQPVDDSTLVGLSWSYDEFMGLEGEYRLAYVVLRLSMSGEVIDTIATIPGSVGYKRSVGEGYRDYALPFRIDGYLDANAFGIVMGSSDRLQFSRYLEGGGLDHIARVPVLDEPLSAEDITRARNAMLRPESSAEYRRLVEQLPVPGIRPGFEDLLLDSEGITWVARYRGRTEYDDPIEWRLFGSDGEWLGQVRTPARFSVFEIGPDYVLGSRRDEVDVEHVQLLRLHRARRPPA